MANLDTNRINRGIFNTVAINDDILDAFIDMGTIQTFSHLDKICGIGERSYFIGFIVEGKASVLDADGMVFAQIQKGDVFGEISLILDSPHTANVIGVGEGYFLRIEFEDINKFFSTKPNLQSQWLDWLSKKVADRLSMFVNDKRKYVAMISNDERQDILIQFAIENYGLLNKLNLVATSNIGKDLLEKASLSLSRSVSSGLSEGGQSIGTLITTGNIDAVIFLKDPLDNKMNNSEIEGLLKLCDIQNIPLATNTASAELLLKGLALEC